MAEISLGESDRLRESGRANRDRERSDDQQRDEIGVNPSRA